MICEMRRGPKDGERLNLDQWTEEIQFPVPLSVSFRAEDEELIVDPIRRWIYRLAAKRTIYRHLSEHTEYLFDYVGQY